MGKGLGAGLVSGGFVGAVVLSILSLYAPLPQDRIDAAPKLEAETPPSETVAPEDDAAAVAPETAAEPIVAEADSAEVAPAADAQTITPTNETQTAAPAAQTETEIVAPDTDTPAVAPDIETATVASDTETAQAPVVASQTPQATASETLTASTDTQTAEAVSAAPAQTQSPVAIIPDDSAATLTAQADSSAAQAVTPEVQEPAGAETLAQADTSVVQRSEVPSETVVGEEQVASVPAPEPTAEAQPDTPPRRSLPTVGEEEVETVSADTPITAPVPQITNPVAGVVTNRLPSLGTPAAVPSEDPAPEATEVAAPIENDALRQFATPVEGAEGKSLFSVLLIDSGEDGIARSELAQLAVPVTVAIDPTSPNARAIMAEYRAAGVEVVAIVNDLPESSEPSDVAVSVSAYFDVLSEAVGLMDPLDGRIQGNRSLLQPVLGAIRDTGHGLITYDRGLNTAQQAARRENIPNATVFRILDAELEKAPKIKRYLDRAAFTANQDGAVVVVGRSYEETVKAIVEWALEKKDASIAMVPVSAVMLATQDGS
ncbi:hypothetical protein C8N43_0572 [Litoreibacter ponti]|uniref:Divergent polysaccharide deacetylase n=1 Tax=Litoreibacter ponti TaxID=1510457 RepID=A0A2T6BIP5_9RHOB|nr:divergent polysaccharide deacetylase family protein [Litoreibacter ponti]PTX55924.1 hypothetical protein C8N43_0572 [Litoreibacter ponti]